jgi:PhoPQ-activated pathogenicity-related protein
MSEDLPFLERILRVTHSHVAHRAKPPTRFEPWTNRNKGSEAYRQYIGYAVIDADTDVVSYCYLVPDFESPEPVINVHFGPTGDPASDPLVAVVRATWHG